MLNPGGWMYEPGHRRTALTGCAVLGVSRLLVCLHDAPHLTESQLPLYFGGVFVIVGALAVYFVVSWRSGPPAHLPVALYLLGMAYATHGQLFRPHFWLAFIEINTLFPMFFLVHERTLAALYGVGLLGFDAVFLATSDRHVAAGAFNQQMSWDILLGTMWTTAVALIGYHAIVALRLRKNVVHRRFFEVGKNLEFVLHDVKGLLTTPIVYAEVLDKASTEGRLTEQEHAALRFLREDLTATRELVADANRLLLASFEADEPRWVSVRQALTDAHTLMRSKLKHVSLKQVGDVEVQAGPQTVRQILISALANSSEAILQHGVEAGEITVVCDADELRITDNSGACLDADALHRLNSTSRTFTDKPLGTGLGTLIIRDQVHAMGGTVRFANGDQGVEVSIRLPRRITRAQA